VAPKKRECIFNEQLRKEFPFITKTGVSGSHVGCNTCGSNFSINHSERRGMKTDVNSDKQKRAISAAASSSLLIIFLRPEKIGNKEEQFAAAEGPFACHSVSHIHNFRSMDCTSKLLQITLEPKFAVIRKRLHLFQYLLLHPIAKRSRFWPCLSGIWLRNWSEN
jgi:hypothetical protein